MILTTIFRAKGREYSLSLDTENTSRNHDDENYAEWLFDKEDERVIVITVWKDSLGRFTRDGIAEVYKSKKDFDNDRLLDKKNIIIRTL